MPTFRVQLLHYHKQGESIHNHQTVAYQYTIDLPCKTVEEALQHSKVERYKKQAKEEGYGFRVTREDKL